MYRFETLEEQKRKMDSVVMVLLDQVLEMTGFDPSHVLPEFELKKDLELSRAESLKLVNDTLYVLNKSCGTELVNPQKHEDFSGYSLRQIGNWIKALKDAQTQAMKQKMAA